MLGSVCVAVLHGSSHAGSALDKPAFTATPAELLAAAKSPSPGDWPVRILRDDTEISFDERGRATRTWRMVFVIQTQAGVDDWGTLSTAWSPFYQDKPVVRARVISPKGTVAELDGSLVSDAPLVATSATVFSDRRALHVPLPRFEIGSVIEEEMITKDREPILAAGSVETVWLGAGVPTAATRVVLSAPSGLKARQVAKGLPAGAKPRHEVKGGRETWTYELGALAARDDVEPSVPSDTSVMPYVGITTAPSWGAVARSYLAVVEKRLADGPVTLPAELPRTPTIESVRTIVAWLHRNIRYTGIEFGDASNVPWPPAETIKRGFGDCKDKATLLVALLKQAGIRAELALLQTGPGTDIDAALAGIDGFDHAIVHARVGATDVWIDATEDLVIVGELPPRDQGRRALLIASETTALTTTPRATNTLMREVRTFDLSEAGAAKVTEIATATGAFDAENRSWVRDERAENVRKHLGSYVEAEYKAKALASYTTTAPEDLSKPFTWTLVVTESSRAFTSRDRIDVHLFPADTFDRVPKLLVSEPDAKKPRKAPYEWFTPHVYEIENRLVLPPGFAAPTVPPDRTRTLGTAKLIETHKLDGRTLVYRYRFETGKQRLTAAELTALQKAMTTAAEEEVHIVIEHTAWALAERGKPREAIAEVQRVIALHPKEAIHHTDMAAVLLKAGAGQAARRAARKAVELEPKNADALAVLAWVLRHDTLGREFGFDHDRAGALAAYEKARALDPKHVGAAQDHAQLLERDPDDLPIGAERDLSKAIEARRAAVALEDSTDNKIALARVLLRAGKAEEAATLAKTLPAADIRDSLLIASTAAASGAPAAIGLASAMRSGAARTALLDSAAAVLLVVRRYDAARALFAETGSARAGTAQGMMVQRVKKHTEKFVVGKDPAKAALDVMLAMIVPDYKSQAVTDEKSVKRLKSSKLRQTLAPIAKLGDGFLNDLVRSSIDTRVEGSGAGPWRVEGEVFAFKYHVYVALEGNAAKVVGSPEDFPRLGRFVLARLAAKDVEGARRLLDWFAADLQASQAGATLKTRFAQLWGQGLARDASAAALAAAYIAGDDPAGIPALTKCATTAKDAKPICETGLVISHYNAKDWRELEKAAATWYASDTTNALALEMQCEALAFQRKFDEARKLAADHLVRYPNDRSAKHAQIEIAVLAGDVEAAVKLMEAYVSDPGVTGLERNNAAWYYVVLGKGLPRALELARLAVQQEQDKQGRVLNTLATIEAEIGDVGPAKTDEWRSMEVDGVEVPENDDWYVIGRILEQLGLRDDAVAAYKRIKPPSRPQIFGSGWDLAQRRLKVLGKP